MWEQHADPTLTIHTFETLPAILILGLGLMLACLRQANIRPRTEVVATTSVLDFKIRIAETLPSEILRKINLIECHGSDQRLLDFIDQLGSHNTSHAN
jgi:hypothetical protein